MFIARPLPKTLLWIDSFATGILLLAVLSTTAVADSPDGWLRFRGPGGQGYVAQGELPNSWNESDYAWRRSLGSRDVGSPVVVGQRVFLLVSHPDQKQIALECLDLSSGQLMWSKRYEQHPHHLHSRNTFASSTPVADQRYVYTSWADAEHTFLKCFDHEGNEVWSRDFGPWQSQHGFGTSPTIVGSMVLLLNSQQAEQLDPGESPGTSRLIAVDRSSGETLWQTQLKTTRSCYGVPTVFVSESGTQIIAANTGNGMFALDASTGKMLWQLPVFPTRCCSTPLIVGDIAMASSGSGGGNNQLVAVRLPRSSDQEPEELYRIKRNAPYVPTPAIKDGRMFAVDDRGIASCIDVSTGKPLWVKRIGGNFGASPIIVGDKVLLVSLGGIATVLRASDEFEQLGEADLGGPVGATPTYANGRLLLRVGEELRCLATPAI